jgi:hypothetical protein
MDPGVVALNSTREDYPSGAERKISGEDRIAQPVVRALSVFAFQGRLTYQIWPMAKRSFSLAATQVYSIFSFCAFIACQCL